MINEHLSNLRSLLAREHRWAGEYAEEDRIANIAALEWAIEQCSGHESNQDSLQYPAPSGDAGLGTTGQALSTVQSSTRWCKQCATQVGVFTACSCGVVKALGHEPTAKALCHAPALNRDARCQLDKGHTGDHMSSVEGHRLRWPSEPVECEHLRSELLAVSMPHQEPFEMRKCLDCTKIFRVRKTVGVFQEILSHHPECGFHSNEPCDCGQRTNP